jgi:ParB family chromosome partitioning protein
MSESARPSTIPNVISAPVEQVHASAHQVRHDFDDEGLKSLAESIAKEGLLQPVTVRRVGDHYELVAGERRLRAVKLLGQPTIDAIVVKAASEAAASAKGLVENLQRKDLNAIEEAEGFARLNALDPGYWTQEMIGTISGRKRTEVNRSIALLGLPEAIKENLRNGSLSREHGLELLRLKDRSEQPEVGEKAKTLTVKKTRDLIDSILGKAEQPDAPQSQEPKGGSFRFTKKGSEMVISGRFPLDTGKDALQGFLGDAFQIWEEKAKTESAKIPPTNQ